MTRGGHGDRVLGTVEQSRVRRHSLIGFEGCPVGARNPGLELMTRRGWLRAAGVAAAMGANTGWLGALAADAARHSQRRRSCILLWMNGGPSTFDLWDLKPGHANGGPFKEIATTVPGLRVGELLPKMSRWAERLAVVRSMKTKEGDHGRATYLLRTGSLPMGAIQYPVLGSLVAKELAAADMDLPAHVRIAPPPRDRTFGLGNGAGFLGPRFAPLVVGEAGEAQLTIDDALQVPDLARPADVDAAEATERVRLLNELNSAFAVARPSDLASAHHAATEQSLRLMRPEAAREFRLDEEPAVVRDRYGRTLFGQGCLLARRLVERGVPFVEVGTDGWDTHNQNFDALRRLVPPVDTAWAALMQDLNDRGLLDNTTIAWMGEFGRTPKINSGSGRDHFPAAWAAVLAGGGIKGGQAIGRTSAGGDEVTDRPVTVPDLLATVCRALGIDPLKQNQSNVGRPIRIVDKAAHPIDEVLA